MNKSDVIFEFFLMLFLVIIGFGGIFFAGFGTGMKYIQLEAVKNGAAEWVADEKGQAQFKWKSEVSLEQVQP